MIEPTTRTFFGLRHAQTGELLRVHEDQDTGYCRLSTDPQDSVFEAGSMAGLETILFEDTFSMNSSRECPGWGGLAREIMEPVRVSVTCSSEPVQLPLARTAKTVDVRDLHPKVAANYAKGTALPGDERRFTFWLVELPQGETSQTARAWEGEMIRVDKYTGRRLYRSLPVPEDHLPLLEGKTGALFIASESQAWDAQA